MRWRTSRLIIVKTAHRAVNALRERDTINAGGPFMLFRCSREGYVGRRIGVVVVLCGRCGVVAVLWPCCGIVAVLRSCCGVVVVSSWCCGCVVVS